MTSLTICWSSGVASAPRSSGTMASRRSCLIRLASFLIKLGKKEILLLHLVVSGFTFLEDVERGKGEERLLTGVAMGKKNITVGTQDKPITDPLQILLPSLLSRFIATQHHHLRSRCTTYFRCFMSGPLTK